MTPPPRYRIELSDRQSHVAVQAQPLIELAHNTLAAEAVTAAEISIALVDDATIRQLNRRHRHLDHATDVLSFPLDDDPAAAAPGAAERRIEGEIVVSAETAARAATEFDSTPHDELRLYLVHGLLHLCGYDDATDQQRRAIRRRERELLPAHRRKVDSADLTRSNSANRGVGARPP